MKTLRWIIALPVAATGGFIVFASLNLLLRWFRNIEVGNADFLTLWWFAGISAAAFVAIGTLIVPTRRRAVPIVFASIWSTVQVVSLLMSIADADWIDIGRSLSSIAGGSICAIWFCIRWR